jgi:DNA polymerase elongation subunit (family B)
MVSNEVIQEFLEGTDPQKYIVAIEASYGSNEVHLVINDPEKGKYIEVDTYQPFLWLKHDVVNVIYGGNRKRIRDAMRKHNIEIKALEISDEDGNVPERLEEGYKYMAICKDGSYNNLTNFFKYGGLEVYSKDKDRPKYFTVFSPVEQYLIQTGKRLFKGMDDYDDIHRLQFDLETDGLLPTVNSIFQIGVRDNRGFEKIIEVKGNTPKERRESEKAAITEFFDIIDRLKPDLITGYNSENFDWDFIQVRCKKLYINFEQVAKTLNPSVNIKRKDSTLKIGADSENYVQTYMWGYNIVDIWHSVLKTQAINSEIKESGLKYITVYSKIQKKNRVYVVGDQIHSICAYKEVTGAYIIQRYLMDDLWETEKVDGKFNQAAYLVGKLLPTSYMRSTTMGTASQWKLIMAGWSYSKGLAVPALEVKRKFTGGLSRLVEVGYARNVVKLDFAALYPKIELTHDIFPDLDISGVMKGLLTYIVDTRDKFKFLMGGEKAKEGKLKDELAAKRDSLTEEEIKDYEKRIKEANSLKDLYDKKQLPLKILANSFFGAFGAPYIFNWGDTNCAEETTCRGRQYLRLMVRHFTETHGFRALVGDTDGFNFAIPDHIDTIKYVCKANHWKTEKYEAGTELVGLEAVLAEFNEEFMIGRMGLDIDDICESTINFSRKNYANDIDGKVKLVGNTIKSKKMPKYIEEFLGKGIRLLLDGKGYEFVQLYQETVDDIYNYRIPLVKIASKAKVKESLEDYAKYCLTKNKAGQYKSKKAHMEIVKAHNLNVNYGDTIYYVNVGTTKSQGDVKKVKDKKTGKEVVELMCKHIPTEQIEKNPDLTTDEYNVAKYIDMFNKRITPLLVCFEPDIREDFLLGVSKVTRKDINGKIVRKDGKIVKDLVLDQKPSFTRKQCELTAGKPMKPEHQDSYEELMTMEDKEILFWTNVDKVPNNIDLDEWEKIKEDYFAREKQRRLDEIQAEKDRLDEIFKRFEVQDLEQLRTVGILPKQILAFADVTNDVNDNPVFYSKEWNVALCSLHDLFKYEEDAKERVNFYKEMDLNGLDKDERYDAWLESKLNDEFEDEIMSGDTSEEKPIDSIASREESITSVEVETELAEHDVIPEDLSNEELIEAERDVCDKGECGGCEHCDGMGSPEAQKIEHEAMLQNPDYKITMDDVKNCDDCDDDEWGF